jgi:hypothetical protein
LPRFPDVANGTSSLFTSGSSLVYNRAFTLAKESIYIKVYLSTLASDIPAPVYTLEGEEVVVGEYVHQLDSLFHATGSGESSWGH